MVAPQQKGDAAHFPGLRCAVHLNLGDWASSTWKFLGMHFASDGYGCKKQIIPDHGRSYLSHTSQSSSQCLTPLPLCSLEMALPHYSGRTDGCRGILSLSSRRVCTMPLELAHIAQDLWLMAALREVGCRISPAL